jgi:hypothetical protein
VSNIWERGRREEEKKRRYGRERKRKDVYRLSASDPWSLTMAVMSSDGGEHHHISMLRYALSMLS